MSKSVLLLTKDINPRVSYFRESVKGVFDVIDINNVDEAVKELDERQQEVVSIIVDNPSDIKDINSFISGIKKWNAFSYSVPIIVLTDQENESKNEDFLNKTVISVIHQGESKKVIIQRINRSSKAINSASFQEFADILKVLPSLIYLKDSKGRYVFSSKNWHHYDIDIRGKTDIEARKNKENGRMAYEADMKVIDTGVGQSYIIKEMMGDIPEYFQVIKEPVKNKEGKVRGVIGIVNNVTDQENLRIMLQHKSITDQLTGLYNRFYFNEFVETLNPKDYPISIISADCDDLKVVNDKYGHQTGDEYIKLAVSLIHDHVPTTSIVFRMGGDEFLIALKGVDESTCKDIEKDLDSHSSEYIVKDVKLNISFGSHTIEDENESFDDGVAISDIDMYKNKRIKKLKMNKNKK